MEERSLSLPEIVGFRGSGEDAFSPIRTSSAAGAGKKGKKKRHKRPRQTTLPAATNMGSLLLRTLADNEPYLPPIMLRVKKGKVDYLHPKAHGPVGATPERRGGVPRDALPQAWRPPPSDFLISRAEFILDESVPVPAERAVTPPPAPAAPRRPPQRDPVLTRDARLRLAIEEKMNDYRANPRDRVDLVSKIVRHVQKRGEARDRARFGNFLKKNALIARHPERREQTLEAWREQHRARLEESQRRRAAAEESLLARRIDATSHARRKKRHAVVEEGARQHRQRAWMLVLATVSGSIVFRNNLNTCILQANMGTLIARQVVRWFRVLRHRRRIDVKANNLRKWLVHYRIIRLRNKFLDSWRRYEHKITVLQRLFRRNKAQAIAQMDCLVQKWNNVDRQRVHANIEALRLYCIDEINRDLRDKARVRNQAKRRADDELTNLRRMLPSASPAQAKEIQAKLRAEAEKTSAAGNRRRVAEPLVPMLLTDEHLSLFVHYVPEDRIRPLMAAQLVKARAEWVEKKRKVYDSLYPHFKQVLGWEMKQADPTVRREEVLATAERMRDDGLVYSYLLNLGYGLDGVGHMPPLRYLDFDCKPLITHALAKFLIDGGETPAEMQEAANPGSVQHPVPSKASKASKNSKAKRDFPTIPKVERLRQEAFARAEAKRLKEEALEAGRKSRAPARRPTEMSGDEPSRRPTEVSAAEVANP